MRTELLVACGCLTIGVHAETGYDAWLRYAPLDQVALSGDRATLPAVVSTLGNSELAASGRAELIRAVRGMLGRTLRAQSGVPKESAIVLGTLAELRQAAPQWQLAVPLDPDGYWLKTVQS